MRWIGSGLVVTFVALLAIHVTSEPGTSIISRTIATQQHLIPNSQASNMCLSFWSSRSYACITSLLCHPWLATHDCHPVQANSAESATAKHSSVLTGLLQTAR
jgi:hypothetical protein